MTDLNISYEDGLRLSELNGTLEGLKYQAAHIFETNMPLFILAVLLGIIISFAVVWFLGEAIPGEPGKNKFDSDEDPKRWATCIYTYKVLVPAGQEERKIRSFNPNINGFETSTYMSPTPMEVDWRMRFPISISLFIVIPVLIIAAVVGIVEIGIAAGIEMQMVDVQAQIDTILAKYGGA